MSGHSKWANIRVRKTAQDARRGKIYTKHARLIEMAAREGGGDPVQNARLRSSLENARAESIPSSIIERAIKKGTGALKDAARMEELTYEAFGPGGTAYLIECLTENKNRTIANVKNILHRHDGRFAESGSVSWMFERKGVVVTEMNSEKLKIKNAMEDFELQLIDIGAEDIQWSDTRMIVTTKPERWGSVRDALKNAGCSIEEAGLKYVPVQTVEIADPALAERLINLLQALEADDDVAEVHTNAEFGQEIMKKLS